MPTKKTKAYYRFLQRCDYYETDLALCDLLVRNFVEMPDSTTTLAEALGSSKALHPDLGQTNARRSREVRGGHLKRTLAASFLKDLYEDFVDYVSETMARAALAGVDPARFTGEAKFELHAREVLGAGDWDGVVGLISQKVFRALEGERRTTALVGKSAARLGLTIDQTVIDAAMPYLDARHMFVHQDGRADAEYKRKYPAVALRDGRINADQAFVDQARRSVEALAGAFDAEIIANGLVRPEHLHP